MTSSFPLGAGADAERHPVHEGLRQLAASGLHSASAALARLAGHLAAPAARSATTDPQLEFHAEAGAPEGALYLDGRLVGWVQGVTRL
jgi:hypothetical protein